MLRKPPHNERPRVPIALENQEKILQRALTKIIWKVSPRSINDAKARFPGFRQRAVYFKTRQVIEKGALPLPIDIVMHESVSMLLSERDQTLQRCLLTRPV